MNRRCALLLGLLSIATVTGCATVRPYERERLAQRDMRFERDVYSYGRVPIRHENVAQKRVRLGSAPQVARGHV